MASPLGLDLAPKQIDFSPTASNTVAAKSPSIDSSAESGESLEGFSDSLEKVSRPKVSPKKVDAKKAGPNVKAEDPSSVRTDVAVAQQAQMPRIADTENTSDLQESEDFGQALSPRQSVMARFMNQMENKLGVKPEKIVQAMASLTPEELMRSPEETMNLVLNQLDLSLDERPQAETLYQSMLDETARADLQEIPKAQPKMPAMMPEKIQQRDLTASVTKLNEKFVVNQAPSSQVPSDPVVKNSEVPSEFEAMQSAQQNSMGITEEPFAEKPLAQPAVAAIKNDIPARTQTAQNVQSEATSESIAKKLTPDDFFSNQAPPASMTVSTPAGKTTELLSQQGLEGETAQAPTFTPAAVFQPSQAGEQASDSLFDEEAEQGDLRSEVKLDSQLDEKFNLQTAQKPTETLAPQVNVVDQRTDVSRAEQVKNIQDIMSKAQVLVTQGGGEMKVQLNPEGLGQVNLKVAVQNGQVSVQMVAETNEAKRTLESGLSELRTHLASSHLRLDGLKVDVATQSSPDFQQNQHNQQEAAQDMAREFARGFLGNFREERQASHEHLMTDMSRVRGYGSNNAKTRIEEPAASSGSAPSSSRSKNQRLNVVV